MSIFSDRNREWAEGLAKSMMEELSNAPDSIALKAAEMLKDMIVERWKSRDQKGSRRTILGRD
jgi:hypothetical protein